MHFENRLLVHEIHNNIRIIVIILVRLIPITEPRRLLPTLLLPQLRLQLPRRLQIQVGLHRHLLFARSVRAQRLLLLEAAIRLHRVHLVARWALLELVMPRWKLVLIWRQSEDPGTEDVNILIIQMLRRLMVRRQLLKARTDLQLQQFTLLIPLMLDNRHHILPHHIKIHRHLIVAATSAIHIAPWALDLTAAEGGGAPFVFGGEIHLRPMVDLGVHYGRSDRRFAVQLFYFEFARNAF